MPTIDFQLQHYLVPYLAKALIDLFPRIELIKGGVGDYGFYYDFLLEGCEPDAEVAKEIRAKILSLLREGEELSCCEMLRDNAIHYLLSKGQERKALQLKEEYTPGTLSFFRLGDLLEVAPAAASPAEASHLRAFDLYHTSCRAADGAAAHRIEGILFPSLRDLKAYRKRRGELTGRDHLTLAGEMGLYRCFPERGEGVWLPRGIFLRHILRDRWREFCRLLGVEEIATGSSSSEEFSAAVMRLDPPRRFGELLTFEREVAEEKLLGMQRLRRYATERISLEARGEEVAPLLISCLQFIAKTVNILCCGAECHISTPIVSGRRRGAAGSAAHAKIAEAVTRCGIPHKSGGESGVAELFFTYVDPLGKEWRGPSVALSEIGGGGELFAINASLFGSFERAVAALIEGRKGLLPVAIAPLQVKLVAMKSRAEFAESLLKPFREAGVRIELDRGAEGMSERIHRVEKERPSYIAVVGEREALKGTLLLRSGGMEKKGETVTINELLDRINRENKASNFWSPSVRTFA